MFVSSLTVGATVPQCIRKWKNEIGGVSRETIEAAIENVQRERIRIYSRTSLRFTKGNRPRFLESFTKYEYTATELTFNLYIRRIKYPIVLMFAFERTYAVLRIFRPCKVAELQCL